MTNNKIKKYDQEEVKEAFTGLELIKHAVQQNNITPLIIAHATLKAKRSKYFEKNGLTKEDFFGDISMNEKTLNKYEVIYKAFVETGGYSIMDLSKRADVLNRLNKLRTKLFKTKRNKNPVLLVEQGVLDDWISKVNELSTTDFNIEFMQEFGLSKSKEDHDCDWEQKETWQCKKCGDKIFHSPEEHESSDHQHTPINP